MDSPNRFSIILKNLAKSHQDKQRDFAAKELQARVTAYDGELAKMAEEQKELEVECATANENMSRAMKWFQEYKTEKPALLDSVEKRKNELHKSIARLEQSCKADIAEAQMHTSSYLEGLLAGLKLEHEKNEKNMRDQQAELRALEERDAELTEQIRFYTELIVIRNSVDTLNLNQKKFGFLSTPDIKTEIKEEPEKWPDTQLFNASTTILSQTLFGAPPQKISDDEKAISSGAADMKTTKKAAFRKRSTKSVDHQPDRVFVGSDDAKPEVAKPLQEKMDCDVDEGAAKSTPNKNVVKYQLRKRNAKSEDLPRTFIDSTWIDVKVEPHQEAEGKMDCGAIPSPSRQVDNANQTKNPQQTPIKNEPVDESIFF